MKRRMAGKQKLIGTVNYLTTKCKINRQSIEIGPGRGAIILIVFIRS